MKRLFTETDEWGELEGATRPYGRDRKIIQNSSRITSKQGHILGQEENMKIRKKNSCPSCGLE
jgi:hypothetical protein